MHVNHLTLVHSWQLLTSQIRWPLMLPKVLCFLAEQCCCTSREWKKWLLVPFHTKLSIFSKYLTIVEFTWSMMKLGTK